MVSALLEMEQLHVNEMDGMGATALTWATIQGHEEVVKILLEQEDVLPDQRDQCSQPSRPDCRALASNSPVRPGRGWYGRPGKASVLTISRKTAGPGRQPTVLQLISSSGRASPSLELTGVICRARPS